MTRHPGESIAEFRARVVAVAKSLPEDVRTVTRICEVMGVNRQAVRYWCRQDPALHKALDAIGAFPGKGAPGKRRPPYEVQSDIMVQRRETVDQFRAHVLGAAKRLPHELRTTAGLAAYFDVGPGSVKRWFRRDPAMLLGLVDLGFFSPGFRARVLSEVAR